MSFLSPTTYKLPQVPTQLLEQVRYSIQVLQDAFCHVPPTVCCLCMLCDRLIARMNTTFSGLRTHTENPTTLSCCCALNCVLPNSYIEALTSHLMAFGDRTFGKYLGLDEAMRVGPS
jgi:hypothetical protein